MDRLLTYVFLSVVLVVQCQVLIPGDGETDCSIAKIEDTRQIHVRLTNKVEDLERKFSLLKKPNRDMKFIEIYKGSVFFFSEQRKSWDGSWSYCSSIGASLVSGLDEETNTYLKSKVQSNYNEDVWIGGRRNSRQDNFKWKTASGDVLLTWTDWAPLEPSPYGDCMQLWGDRQYRWDNTFCNESHVFVCSMDL